MRCFGQFVGDRMCDMCARVDPDLHSVCKEVYDNSREAKEKLQEIQAKCPHTRATICDGDACVLCFKNHTGGIRSAPTCIPTEECEK